ncbi:unnamed protein product [Didymodactylos carnosus]|uniref:Ty3 transposon capsid-like protein domain-containing protein n=1 Tax=Didymodactylos carnosus TaxID=1234261 RepID=A0A814U8Q4_9BILA|nr:unnamed protein product [Didymodactylos carnosus]CAF3936411.1 unnamed protein product [Didymodactylos carnosus]
MQNSEINKFLSAPSRNGLLNNSLTSLHTPRETQASSADFIRNLRRKSIIPTPNRPHKLLHFSRISTNEEEEQIITRAEEEPQNDAEEVDEQPPAASSVITVENKIRQISSTLKKDETPVINQEDNCNHEFDSFILSNFEQFTGKQDVLTWLYEVEAKFNSLKVNRTFRYDAVPLLVSEEAKHWYIKNRKHIESFDDFYELILLEFHKDNLIFMDPKHRSTTVPGLGAASFSGEIPDSRPATTLTAVKLSTEPTSIIIPSTHITSLSTPLTTPLTEQTTIDLRRAVLENLVKSPKTFSGGNNDVKKWLEELQNTFDIAHIPDDNKLNIISYQLKGEAFIWYNENKKYFTSWDNFVELIQKAFTSSFSADIAFSKLETYTQTHNQSVRNYYTEMMKLCKEADQTMSDTTKLKYLLSKMKSSLQFEVRMKKPTNPQEFLHYAQEIEALVQLSSLTTNNNNQSSITVTASTTTSAPMPPFVSNTNLLSPTPRPPFNDNYRNNYNSPYRSSFRQSVQPQRYSFHPQQF